MKPLLISITLGMWALLGTSCVDGGKGKAGDPQRPDASTTDSRRSDASQDVPEPSDAAQDAAQDTAQDTAQDAARDAAQDATQDGAPDAARDAAQDAAQDGAQDGAPPPDDGWTPPAGKVLIWSDEFNSLDSAAWSFDPRKSDSTEAQTYRASNAYTTNGQLVIAIEKDGKAGYFSGRIMTDYKKYFGYGTYIVKAKMPQGKGMWPAVWMMGTNEHQVGWPACGEIDIVEMFGGPTNNGDSTAVGTLHYGTTVDNPQSHWKTLDAPLSSDWHYYQIDYSYDAVAWKLDGQEYFRYTITDIDNFHQQFYLLINVAVGNSGLGYPDDGVVFPQYMYIDWVRWYQ